MKKTTIYLLAVFLSGLLFGAVVVYSQTAVSTQYIMGGIYPGATTYTIWKEGSTYYAKDAYGQLIFSGTNASNVVTNTLNAMIAASDFFGILHFAKGYYPFTTEILMERTLGSGWKGGLIVEGEGRYTTVFKAIGAHPIFSFHGYTRDDRFESLTFHSIEFTSDAVAQSVGDHALKFVNATFVNIYDCYFENNYDSSIYMEGLETNFIHDNGIYHSYGDGIDIVGVGDTHISGNSIVLSEGDGISVNGAIYTNIEGNTILYSNQSGIVLYSSSRCSVNSNPAIGANFWDGIQIVNCENITVSDNVIFSNSRDGGGLGDGIVLGNSNHTILNSNRIFDDAAVPLQEYGIHEEGASTYNVIMSCNTINGGTICGIKMAALEASSKSRVGGSYNGTVWVATWGSG